MGKIKACLIQQRMKNWLAQERKRGTARAMFQNRQEGMGLNTQVEKMTLDSNTGSSFIKAGNKAEHVSADSGKWWWKCVEVLF